MGSQSSISSPKVLGMYCGTSLYMRVGNSTKVLRWACVVTSTSSIGALSLGTCGVVEVLFMEFLRIKGYG